MRSWIIFSLCFFLAACEPQQANLSPLHIETATGVRGFKVELARTPDEMARGLMFRRQMPADQGMLFIFPEDRSRQFLDEEHHSAAGSAVYSRRRHDRGHPSDGGTLQREADFVWQTRADGIRNIGRASRQTGHRARATRSSFEEER
jgi:hypothetical protein